jgi:hypothetical protein
MDVLFEWFRIWRDSNQIGAFLQNEFEGNILYHYINYFAMLLEMTETWLA